jgi:hypothetical protein
MVRYIFILFFLFVFLEADKNENLLCKILFITQWT